MKVIILIGLALGSMASVAHESVNAPTEMPPGRCVALLTGDLSGLQDAPTHLTSAAVTPAASGVPAYCVVAGYVAPQVGFEIRLPDNWNGKFLALGSGGWGGAFDGDACNTFLTRGYGCLVTDTGHKGGLLDGLWARDNLAAQVDFGYRAVHVSALAGKSIVERYYTKAPRRSYFIGCSTGGYEGLVEAQRFPWDFQGIVAGSPDMDEADLMMRNLWNAKTFLQSSGQPVLSSAEIVLLHRAALAACDMDDGVRDGIISSPLTCGFDPVQLLCKVEKNESCLLQYQVDAVKRLYAGPSDSAGTAISTRGVLPGSELTWDDISIGLNGTVALAEAASFFRYMVYGSGSDWRAQEFDFDRDYKRFGLATLYSDTNPDLRKFKAAGGKLLVYQGGNDLIEVPNGIVDYYETTEKTVGGRKATQDFFRLFVMPAMDHCAGGGGAYAVDYLRYLEAWVEERKPPDVMVAAHVSDAYLSQSPERQSPGIISTPALKALIAALELTYPLDSTVPIAFTRPIFPYPAYAVYTGFGDVNKAKNFVMNSAISH